MERWKKFSVQLEADSYGSDSFHLGFALALNGGLPRALLED